MVGRNELQRDDGGRIRAVDTGERETIECGLVLRSIGYKGIPIEGVPFDERAGTISNEGGRVTDGGEQVPGLYAVGWIKRGPSGVIGTNKKDAQETVDNLFADFEAGKIPERRAGRRPRLDRGTALRAQARPRHLRGLAGDRRRRGRSRQAARPPAGQALQGRRAGRGLQGVQDGRLAATG